MGLFSSSSSSSSSTTSTPSSSAGGAPDRSARAQCWAGRDAYFACLDRHGVQVPGQEEGGACAREDREYRSVCAGSWVDYFNKRRVLQLRQDLMERKAAEQISAQAAAKR